MLGGHGPSRDLNSVSNTYAPDTFGRPAQFKDVVTAIIAFAAFLTALTNVWVAYLRRHKLRSAIGDVIRVGYGPGPDENLLMRLDVVLLNVGARPGVVTRMRLELSSGGDYVDLLWTEFLKTGNIANRGERRRVWTDFEGFAAPILVPKYDARLIEAGFWTNRSYKLRSQVEYSFELKYWVAGRKRAIKGSRGTIRALGDDAITFLRERCTTNSEGIRPAHLPLRDLDGRGYVSFIPPQPPVGAEERVVRS